MGKTSLVCGIGINDADYFVTKGTKINGKTKMLWTCPYYAKWHSMLVRCYGGNKSYRQKSYDGCSVCDEWLIFSNFKRWMEGKEWEGMQLDKDIKIEGNKMYSPESCMFVTHEVNSFLTTRGADRGDWPLGVVFRKDFKKFRATLTRLDKRVRVGHFDTPMEAHKAWQRKKLEFAIEIRDKQDRSEVIQGLNRVIAKLEHHIANDIETTSL